MYVPLVRTSLVQTTDTQARTVLVLILLSMNAASEQANRSWTASSPIGCYRLQPLLLIWQADHELLVLASQQWKAESIILGTAVKITSYRRHVSCDNRHKLDP